MMRKNKLFASKYDENSLLNHIIDIQMFCKMEYILVEVAEIAQIYSQSLSVAVPPNQILRESYSLGFASLACDYVVMC